VKPHIKGEFLKECIVTAAKLLPPNKMTLFQKDSLSRRTVSDWIQEMGDDIEKNTEGWSSAFRIFVLAFDETTDITDTAQLAIFIRGLLLILKSERICCH